MEFPNSGDLDCPVCMRRSMEYSSETELVEDALFLARSYSCLGCGHKMAVRIRLLESDQEYVSWRALIKAKYEHLIKKAVENGYKESGSDISSKSRLTIVRDE